MFITISLLLAAACLLPAVGKLTGNPKMRQSAAHFGIPWSRYRLIGVAELAAAAGVVTGLWWHPLGVAAAAEPRHRLPRLPWYVPATAVPGYPAPAPSPARPEPAGPLPAAH